MGIVAVIDTNVWVSALINPRGFPSQVLDAWLKDRYVVVISLLMLEELEQVLSRPRLCQRFSISDSDKERLLALIIEKANLVKADRGLKLQICRDPRDNMILETALAGKATHIVSRDEDLTRDIDLVRELETQGIRAVTVNNFLLELMIDKEKDHEE